MRSEKRRMDKFIAYLSKGDVALSVGMTAINTLLAPVVTPFIVYMFLNTVVEIDILKMLSISDISLVTDDKEDF